MDDICNFIFLWFQNVTKQNGRASVMMESLIKDHVMDYLMAYNLISLMASWPEIIQKNFIT